MASSHFGAETHQKWLRLVDNAIQVAPTFFSVFNGQHPSLSLVFEFSGRVSTILTSGTPEEMRAIHSEDIHKAVCAMASTKETYELRVTESDERMFHEGLLIWVTSCINYVLRFHGTREVSYTRAAMFLSACAHIFETIWDKRDSILASVQASGTLKDRTSILADLLLHYVVLHRSIQQRFPAPWALVTRLTMFYWVFAGTNPFSQEAFLRTVLMLASGLESRSREEKARFFEAGAVCGGCKDMHPEKLRSMLIRQLETHSVIDTSLAGLLQLIRTIQDASTILSDSFGGLYRAILIACQRQLCTGSGLHTSRIIRGSFKVIRAVFERYPYSQSDYWTTLAALVCTSINSTQIILLAARAMTYSVSDGTKDDINTILVVLTKLFVILHRTQFVGIVSGFDVVGAARSQANGVWKSTLDTLDGAEFVNMPLRPYARALWNEFGQQILEQLNSAVLHSTEEHPTRSLQRCHWTGCICSMADPASHDLRLCSGCKLTAYCNRTCQTRDWARHKKECHTL